VRQKRIVASVHGSECFVSSFKLIYYCTVNPQFVFLHLVKSHIIIGGDRGGIETK
jgi:hypothetical protein